MPEKIPNSFLNNTPNSSPLKSKDRKRFRRRSVYIGSSSSSSSILSSPSKRNNKNIYNNPHSAHSTNNNISINHSSSTIGLHHSNSGNNSNNGSSSNLNLNLTKAKSKNTVQYNDRFLPNRTDLDYNSMGSLSNSIKISLNSKPSSTEDQIEVQKERQIDETFDALLKNEIFGEKLLKDSLNNESTIDRIKSTRNSTNFSNTRRRLFDNSNNSPTNSNGPNIFLSGLPSNSNYTSSGNSNASADNISITNNNSSNINNNNSGHNVNNLYGRNPTTSNTTSPTRLSHSNTYSSSIHNDDSLDSIDYSSDELVSTPPDSQQFGNFYPTSIPSTPNRGNSLIKNNNLNGNNNNMNDSILSSNVYTTRGATVLTYRNQSPRRLSTASLLHSQFFDSVSPVRPDSKKLLLSPTKKFREIAKVPFRVLDAPSLADDFYYDLIDWSSTDMLAVALGQSIFLTDNNTSEIIHLCDTKNEFTSLSWINTGSHIAIGQSNGIIEIYDVTKRKCIRTLSGHTDRTACLSWNSHILTSGSRDRTILHRDVRMKDPFFERIKSHTQEVCGLKWNESDNKLVSGGNDNTVNIYDGCMPTPLLTLDEHTAAVKALAWSPHKRGILATGGGTADRKLKIWNINSSVKVNEVDTGSQVCNMIWSKNSDELVTSHGYSKYNLTLWNYPTLDPIAILKGHSFRVLHLTLSSDGTTVVSGAGDETLRYWKIFDKVKAKPKRSSILFDSFNQIR
ncbi:hypothetical protein TBLA_0G01490 [Henningerozyma blattae CBS 6284]|uniref:CDC20/Fizzy WD40 domain-containing protein n=1 Tax=Henningerozyma blattae (strain ATCC 34711 / CBS 6284 / DSM 70876 / NBRC 10599 / NRRL Y-10934 / UCD 77-7) TaxID=1071380 RepID=I2H6U3_HENB6|nr:hypothetical protein TBLA_0G01490 [Tetrapisispora blattae CBS 6284]CCH62095.1 hypothetical protein TBLA_0G01490 [Tetrapisispora blattae CBS 6284]